MRDGVELATDVYLSGTCPAPAIIFRTPYGRANDKNIGVFLVLARRGYVVVAQDCRGTGDSQPDAWDYYMYEAEDSYDCVEWAAQQRWYNGFLGSCGGSYAGQTQWCMATHPKMSTIAPEVSGLGVASNTAHLYLFLDSYAKSVGKGVGKNLKPLAVTEREMLEQTLKGGFYNEPFEKPFPPALIDVYPELGSLKHAEAQSWLWAKYCSLTSAQRAGLVKKAFNVKNVTIVEVERLAELFGHAVPHDAHTLPAVSQTARCQSILAPPLIVTGWYDWCLNDALATWRLLNREGRSAVASTCRLIITPGAHNGPGYHEGLFCHPELQRTYRTDQIVGLLLRWFDAVQSGKLSWWPKVIYYLMGANEWRAARSWPPAETNKLSLYLAPDAGLSRDQHSGSAEESFVYDPRNPTPTLGGSILSNVYVGGSTDISILDSRPDVLTYTTPVLDTPLDVVGDLRLELYVRSTVRDTDFVSHLSDVGPDGRAILIQSGILRSRFRSAIPTQLTPGNVHRLEIDMWATAHRFMSGHRLRLSICSSDFPRFDRNTNRGGKVGLPIPAKQTVLYGKNTPSRLILSILMGAPNQARSRSDG
ncbi:MAG: CocE/NonD family hydrolase [Alphaproteobacteria bacterium]|nr:CocE/NonD family hydrolase [Alphaproteobacteria bacterium]MDE2493065.1 CocE/NonD family hydrolase [Alphaproteobacteria bacterium]